MPVPVSTDLQIVVFGHLTGMKHEHIEKTLQILAFQVEQQVIWFPSSMAIVSVAFAAVASGCARHGPWASGCVLVRGWQVLKSGDSARTLGSWWMRSGFKAKMLQVDKSIRPESIFIHL